MPAAQNPSPLGTSPIFKQAWRALPHEADAHIGLLNQSCRGEIPCQTRPPSVSGGPRLQWPWIYDNDIAEILGEPADGGIVRIEDYNRYPLGVGFLNRASTIAVRLLSRDAGAVIDRDFLERRVRAAWQYRKDTVDTSSCRVIFGEADFLGWWWTSLQTAGGRVLAWASTG